MYMMNHFLAMNNTALQLNFVLTGLTDAEDCKNYREDENHASRFHFEDA